MFHSRVQRFPTKYCPNTMTVLRNIHARNDFHCDISASNREPRYQTGRRTVVKRGARINVHFCAREHANRRCPRAALLRQTSSAGKEKTGWEKARFPGNPELLPAVGDSSKVQRNEKEARTYGLPLFSAFSFLPSAILRFTPLTPTTASN